MSMAGDHIPAVPALAISRANGNQDEDQLSDYLPVSAEISRVASKAPSEEKEDEEEEIMEEEVESEEEEEEEVEEMEVDGASSTNASPSKLAKQMEKEQQKLARKSEREAKKGEKAKRDAGLNSKRSEMNLQKMADSMKRFNYLLGQTELFQHFIDLKSEKDPQFKKLIEESKEKNKKGKRKSVAGENGGARRRKTEKEEDEELLGEDEDEEEAFTFEESPFYVKGGTMRDYQVQGLNWMISLYQHGINGILADEMGLGKTLQTISFLGWLKFFKDTPRFHLVVVPKSTLDNWKREFEFWVPGFTLVTLQGTKEERQAIIQTHILPQKFDVLLTTYEICLREASALKKLSWEYIVIDEAHRIKNVDSMLSQIVRQFNSRSRLLITGTPLQNNLMELWSLLNFLLPDVFSESADFESWFKGKGDEAQDQVVQQLHKVLRPFLLRRVKADVEKSLLPKKEINVFVGLTDMQRRWYKSLLEKDIDAVNGVGSKKEGKTRLLNIVMQLRKCCNHPYLFDGAEPGPPYTTDEHLVFNSGKMIILDKLLKSMKAKGSRVLIFSQMSRLLDILEDYCIFREYQYCRIDGSTAHEDRISAIDEYNKPGSEKFVFLLTTRAGGLGINLTSADVVVLFDSDWNPQADLQAMDRAHRIGQTKQVYVFRFVTEHAVEERILDRAAQKLRLDQLVIQQGRSQPNKAQQNKDDLVDMIQHGAEKIINADTSLLIDDDIDAIIKRGEERTTALQDKYQSLNLDDLNNFKSESTMQWEGQDFSNKGGARGAFWIEPSKRERKGQMNYNVDEYYRGAINPKKPNAPKAPRAPKQIAINDYQFYPAELIELQKRETAAYQKSIGYEVPIKVTEGGDDAAAEEERKKEQAYIESCEPLTEEETSRKEALAVEGFPDWNRREFQAFVRGCERYGRHDLTLIGEEIGPTKTPEEVQTYSKVFWQRLSELNDSEKILQRIEEGEKKREKVSKTEAMLKRKIGLYRLPQQQLKINYGNGTAKGKGWSEDEDRFLLIHLAKYGLVEDCYDLIRGDIGKEDLFR
jgi:SWI/SNF-related matrix-associated actin-dependent regulator of chromatin subfamily A member 5